MPALGAEAFPGARGEDVSDRSLPLSRRGRRGGFRGGVRAVEAPFPCGAGQRWAAPQLSPGASVSDTMRFTT